MKTKELLKKEIKLLTEARDGVGCAFANPVLKKRLKIKELSSLRIVKLIK